MKFIPALLLAAVLPLSLSAIDAGSRSNHGEEIAVDLPDDQHRRNITSRGQGCCTWVSLHHAATYQNVPAFFDAYKWIQSKGIPGGANPDDWDRHLPQMAKERGYPMPDLVQHTGGDVEFLKLALKTGRYVCVTYNGRDGVFYNGSISHMVNLVHLSDDWAVIHDNNYPKQYLWMTPEQFFTRWRGGGGGWAAVLLASPPPPVPTTKPEVKMNALIMTTLLTAPGQWGLGQCAPVRGAPITAAYHGWYQQSNRMVELWWNGERVGTLDPTAGHWQTAGKSHWVPLQSLALTGEVTPFKLEAGKGLPKPPQCICKDDCKCKQCPEGCVASAAAVIDESRPFEGDPMPGGVKPNWLGRADAYTCNGRACSRQQALSVLAKANLVDDRDKAFLTVVGDEQTRKRVLADLETSPALAPWRGKLHVNAYNPGDWHVAQVGLQTGITYQAPQGSSNVVPVEFRFRSYAGDVALAEAIRKVDPRYQPDKDPDPIKKPEPVNPVPNDQPNKSPSTVDWTPPTLLLVLLIGGLLVGGSFLYSKNKK